MFHLSCKQATVNALLTHQLWFLAACFDVLLTPCGKKLIKASCYKTKIGFQSSVRSDMSIIFHITSFTLHSQWLIYQQVNVCFVSWFSQQLISSQLSGDDSQMLSNLKSRIFFSGVGGDQSRKEESEYRTHTYLLAYNMTKPSQLLVGNY